MWKAWALISNVNILLIIIIIMIIIVIVYRAAFMLVLKASATLFGFNLRIKHRDYCTHNIL